MTKSSQLSLLVVLLLAGCPKETRPTAAPRREPRPAVEAPRAGPAGEGGRRHWPPRSRREVEREQLVKFHAAHTRVDRMFGDFWRCTVRAAPPVDLHLARGSADLTDGLSDAFTKHPQTQAEWLRRECDGKLSAALEQLAKNTPPEAFKQQLARLAKVAGEIRTALTAYAGKIEQRKDEFAIEQEILLANRDFHNVITSNGSLAPAADTPRAVAYANIITCFVPDLVKKAKKITKPPDSQPVVEIYHTCKANPGYADKIRGECYNKRNRTTTRTATFKLLAKKISGDDRDQHLLKYCFKRSRRGFAYEELSAVGKLFVRYREVRAGIRRTFIERTEQLAGDGS